MELHNQEYLQQDALEKLHSAMVTACTAKNLARKEYLQAQAELDKWKKRYQLAISANLEHLIPHANYQKQCCEEIARKLKNIYEEQTLQFNQTQRKFNDYKNQVSETPINLQQDSFKKLHTETINTRNTHTITQYELKEAQAKLIKWARRYQLAINAKREDLLFHAKHQKQRYEEIISSLKAQIQQENIVYKAANTNVLNATTETNKQLPSISSSQAPISEKINSDMGLGLIAVGTVAGISLSSTIGGIGLAGGFGSVGIGATPIVCAGAVTGAAAYGALQAIQGDKTALSAIAIGSIGGASVSSCVGGMGLVAPKIGLAVGIGTIPMAVAGGILGLATYGVVKMLDNTATSETPTQVFDRMEEKVLDMDFYSAAKQELQAFLSGEDLNPQFAAIEIEDELQMLKKQLFQK